MNSLRRLQITLIVTLSTAAVFIWGVEFFLSVNERQPVEDSSQNDYSSNAFIEVSMNTVEGLEEDTIVVSLTVDEASENIRGAQVVMRYDADVLEFLDTTQGDFFSHYTENEFSDTVGEINVGGVALGEEYKSSGNYFKLMFRKREDSKTVVSLDRARSFVVDALDARAPFTGELSVEIK